ncbi:hypothetical protein BDP67DRAFT_131108 [Colletotrichum lupini]|nr:hypothetical protein BDP67DRAFT_131108 [Colletotrichum lupini]
MPRVNKRPSLSTSYQHPTVYKINEAYGNTPKEIKLIFSPQFESIFSKVSHVGREAGVSSKVGTYREIVRGGAQKPQTRRESTKKHTTPGMRWSSPTQLLIRPSLACLWESGRDPEFSNGYGRM